MKAKGAENLKFRCTGCGNCCREPLLPLTDGDVKRIQDHTGDTAADIVRWVDRHGIEMDDEPEAFVMLRQGKRVMVLRQENGACRYLGKDARCTIYEARPLGCRIYPFDPDWDSRGKLKRLNIVRATECPNDMDGRTREKDLKALDDRYQAAHQDLNAKIAEWNGAQKKRKREGKAAKAAKDFLAFLGLS